MFGWLYWAWSLANQSQPYAWSLARIERPNRSFDPSQARASSWLSFRHLCYFSQCQRPTPTPSARAWRKVFPVVPVVAEAKPVTPVVPAVAEAEAGVSAQTPPRSSASPSPPRSLWPPRLPPARTPWRRWARPRTPWTPRLDLPSPPPPLLTAVDLMSSSLAPLQPQAEEAGLGRPSRSPRSLRRRGCALSADAPEVCMGGQPGLLPPARCVRSDPPRQRLRRPPQRAGWRGRAPPR